MRLFGCVFCHGPSSRHKENIAIAAASEKAAQLLHSDNMETRPDAVMLQKVEARLRSWNCSWACLADFRR